jgi:hypothetical protein
MPAVEEVNPAMSPAIDKTSPPGSGFHWMDDRRRRHWSLEMASGWIVAGKRHSGNKMSGNSPGSRWTVEVRRIAEPGTDPSWLDIEKRFLYSL